MNEREQEMTFQELLEESLSSMDAEEMDEKKVFITILNDFSNRMNECHEWDEEKIRRITEYLQEIRELLCGSQQLEADEVGESENKDCCEQFVQEDNKKISNQYRRIKRANNNKRSKLMKKVRNHYMKLQSPTTNMSQEPSVEDLTKMLKKVLSKEKERRKTRGCRKDCNIESEVWNHIGTEIKRYIRQKTSNLIRGTLETSQNNIVLNT